MKKLFITGFLSLLCVCAFAQSGTLRIEGVSEVAKGDTVLLLTEETYRTPLKVVAKNNKFSAQLNLSKVEQMLVYWMPKTKNESGMRVVTLAVPGEKIQITYAADGSHYYVSGSKPYKESDGIDRATENMKDPKAKADYMLNFIKQNPNSEGPVLQLNQLDYDGIMRVSEALSSEVRNGRMKTYLDQFLGAVKKEHDAEVEAAKKQAAGVQAPDFTLNDLNGKPLSLSSLRGKYVVLDFWGSWCVWCIRGIPKMKEYYNKYKGKFEILSIDCNDTDQKWRDAVKKYELPWLHVYNPKDSKVLSDYAIQGFPTKILIGPDGKIVKTIVGEDPAFYTFLDDTFGK